MKYLVLLIPFIALSFDPTKLLNYTEQEQFDNKSLVIIKNNKRIFSKYYEGNSETKHLIWSMSKSVSSLLFGIAEDKGLVSRETNINQLFKTKQSYTLKDLLYMSSGIDWAEVYDKSPFNSDVVRMLYIERKHSVSKYGLALNELDEKRFSYSSGDTNLIMAALNTKLPSKLKDSYPWQWLFDPMEVDAIFERDKEGVFLGSSYIYMSSRDLIKLGKLILNKGVYNGKQLVSKDYLIFASKINPYSVKKCSHQMSYGAQFWLNQQCESKTPLADVPQDAVAMLGYQGQSLFVIPSLDLIILRLAKDKKRIDLNKYISSVIGGFN